MKNTMAVSFALALALGGSALPCVAAPVVRVDPAHTSATFSVKHLTLTTVSGTIPVTAANLTLGDDDALTEADATFDLTKIDTHEPDRDNDLRSDHWFDVAKDPEMTFKSTKIAAGADGAMKMDGDLTFHGVTKPISMAVKFEGSVKDQRGRTHIGYSATSTIDRKQWNLGTNFPSLIVGDTITITIELEALES